MGGAERCGVERVAQAVVYAAHRRCGSPERRIQCIDQHWRAERAAGRDGEWAGHAILAGTGDPNDALDSYYGAGKPWRSADGGNSWSLISDTADNLWSFAGEGFAGFAWSTVNPELVVAAVSQAYEGTLVNAGFLRPQL